MNNIIVKLSAKLLLDDIDNIISLKREEWKNPISEQKKWIKTNIKSNDIHIMLFNQKKLIGYNALREAKLKFNNNEKIVYYFDTFIITKNKRGQGLSKLLILKNLEYLSQNQKLSILTCENHMINFYKKLGWSTENKTKYKFINFPVIKNLMSLNDVFKILDNNCKFIL